MSKVKGFGRTNRILTGNFVQKIAHIYFKNPIDYFPDTPNKTADFYVFSLNNLCAEDITPLQMAATFKQLVRFELNSSCKLR